MPVTIRFVMHDHLRLIIPTDVLKVWVPKMWLLWLQVGRAQHAAAAVLLYVVSCLVHAAAAVLLCVVSCPVQHLSSPGPLRLDQFVCVHGQVLPVLY